MSVAQPNQAEAIRMLYDTVASLNVLQTILATPNLVIFDFDDLATMLSASKRNIQAVCDSLDPPTEKNAA